MNEHTSLTRMTTCASSTLSKFAAAQRASHQATGFSLGQDQKAAGNTTSGRPKDKAQGIERHHRFFEHKESAHTVAPFLSRELKKKKTTILSASRETVSMICKLIESRRPAHDRTNARQETLSQIDTKHGTAWKFSRFTVRKKPAKRVLHLQFKMGSICLGESGDSITPCVSFTNSKDQHDTTLIYRLSIRAFEFESFFGLDLLILGK